MLSEIQQIAVVCQTDDLNKVLVDTRALTEEISIFDRFRIGVEVAKVLGSQIQMGVLVSPNRTITPVAENTAVNRGAKYKVFLSMEDAEQWLAGKESEPAHITKR